MHRFGQTSDHKTGGATGGRPDLHKYCDWNEGRPINKNTAVRCILRHRATATNGDESTKGNDGSGGGKGLTTYPVEFCAITGVRKSCITQ